MKTKIFNYLKQKFNWVKKNPYTLWIYNEIRRNSKFFTLAQLNDKAAIDILYKRYTGREIDWKNMNRFTEKLQWIKLHPLEPIMTQCTDKFAVREYVTQKGYSEILNDLLGHWTDVKEINLNQLPPKFVLKASHGSSWNIICHDKQKIKSNWWIYKKLLNSWLKQNLYIYGRERFFKDIPPRIICEKYLEDSSGNLMDYKFFCFHGKIKFIQVDFDRYGSHKQNFYDINWNILPFQASIPSLSQADHKPKSFQQMKEIVADLSSDFDFVRVDLYEVDGKPIFGELTFVDGCGFYNYTPDHFDFEIGKWLVLSKNNPKNT